MTIFKFGNDIRKILYTKDSFEPFNVSDMRNRSFAHRSGEPVRACEMHKMQF